MAFTAAASQRESLFNRVRHITGLDRAIAYTVLARAFQIVGSAGTVLLIVHFLSPIEQGYYYTLLSLVALQTVFELGFSFVILQMAAHESVHLKFRASGQIDGDPVAHARLGSVLQTTMQWYLVAAGVMAATLLPLGMFFFSKQSRNTTEVGWRGPWALVVIATALLFFVNPVFSFLEGCGQVREVAGMRLWQGVSAILVPWTALIAHHGLYAPGLGNFGYTFVGLAFLWPRRRLILRLLRRTTGENGVRWRTEVWPLQWRTAVSFLCSYFTVQVLTPVLFAFRGPIEAGRMGMSMSIAAYMWSVVIPWMSTKSSPFGNLIARSEFDKLDLMFFRTLKQSLAVLVAIVVLCMTSFVVIQRMSPILTARLVSPPIFALLLLTALSTFIVQSEAIYLRAHKTEPFLWQSLIVAGLTCGGAMLLVPHSGITGAAVTYFLSTGVIGLLSGTVIFHVRRRERYKRQAILSPQPAS